MVSVLKLSKFRVRLCLERVSILKMLAKSGFIVTISEVLFVLKKYVSQDIAPTPM